MSMFRNGVCMIQDFESSPIANEYRAIPPRGFEIINYTREELEKFLEKNRREHGWVDLETLEVHKPNGEILAYTPDSRMFDMLYDRANFKPLRAGGKNGVKYEPLSAHYQNQ